MVWRLAATASAMLCIGLTVALSVTISRPAIAVLILQADGAGLVSSAGAHLAAPARVGDGAGPGLVRSSAPLPRQTPGVVATPLLLPQLLTRTTTPAGGVEQKR
jgi:hypothetical protein